MADYCPGPIRLTPWCNGNTGDFGSLIQGSNPCGVATWKLVAFCSRKSAQSPPFTCGELAQSLPHLGNRAALLLFFAEAKQPLEQARFFCLRLRRWCARPELRRYGRFCWKWPRWRLSHRRLWRRWRRRRCAEPAWIQFAKALPFAHPRPPDQVLRREPVFEKHLCHLRVVMRPAAHSVPLVVPVHEAIMCPSHPSNQVRAGADGGTRTRTVVSNQRILSPLRLPVPPHRRGERYVIMFRCLGERKT